jgi:hypothetical protein
MAGLRVEPGQHFQQAMQSIVESVVGRAAVVWTRCDRAAMVWRWRVSPDMYREPAGVFGNECDNCPVVCRDVRVVSCIA